MKPLVILSNRRQYDYFVGHYDLSAWAVLCDDPAFSEELESLKISHHRLSEFLLEKKWADVNAWACSRAATWPELCRSEGLFKDFDFPSVIFYHFSHLLVHMLKNYLYAEYVLDHYAPEKVVLFSNRKIECDYPRADGNFFLNYFLKERCEKDGLPFDWCVIEGEELGERERAKGSHSALSAAGLKMRIRPFLAGIAKNLLRLVSKRFRPNATILASGSPKHLGSVLADLRLKGQRILFLDDDFHSEKFLFALRNRIFYCLAERTAAEPFLKDCFSYFLRESEKSLSRSAEHFEFEGHDFSDFIRRYLFEKMGDYFSRIESDSRCYAAILKNNNLRALVVEQDYADRGSFLAALMKRRGVEVFCVSHANTAVDFRVPPDEQKYAKSMTFVNSEFEKNMYQSRGWRGEQIIISGTPRYDRLIRMCAQTKPRSGAGRLKVLVCGASWMNQTPHDFGYLGLHIGVRRELQFRAMCDLFSVANEFPLVDLAILPHHHETEPFWKDFIRKHGDPRRMRLLSASTDVFKLLLDCDAMVLAHWSTTLIEAAIVRLPTIVLNLRSTLSPALREFSEKGFCSIAFDRKGISDAFSGLTGKRTDFLTGQSHLEFYLGKMDGLATSRVANAVLQAVSRTGKCS